MTIDEATRRQIAAASPDDSTWLSANAGSGKTRVLTDRVARLLLNGVPPQNILCLTYTKAAATEMQNRLFARLGMWAMKDDHSLAAELSQLGATMPAGTDGLNRARTLFASALETPGGLRIQTIHSFCASLLRRFPLEAGVSPMFKEMDDRASKKLRDDTIGLLAEGLDSQRFASVLPHIVGDGLDDLAKDVAGLSSDFSTKISNAAIWQEFGLPENFSKEDLLRAVFLGSEANMMARLESEMRSSDSSTDVKNASKIAAITFVNPTLDTVSALLPILIFNEKTKNPFTAKTAAFPTKPFQAKNSELVAELHEFMLRVEHARENFTALLAAEKTAKLHSFANQFLTEYSDAKERRAWVDFDDLINRAGVLLSNPAVAQWVLFRLDGGLDHILIDEAQDTNAAQWKIVMLLAQEFTAGQGAHPDKNRTIFVVGDLKQSIYSFQGADPAEFNRMRQHFETNLTDANQPLLQQSLEHSFRSSKAILDFVDAVFEQGSNQGLDGKPFHQAFHAEMPGRVDVWPMIESAPKPEDTNWYDPTDKPSQNDHRIELAKNIAAEIKSMVECGSIPDGSGEFRKIGYDDFLILVQSRSPLFHHIIRACKSLSLPIAGADRLKVSAELAVRDLKSLLSFLSLPADDLSLAQALRSPLFGVSEAQLFDLAQPRRKNTLWREMNASDGRFEKPLRVLNDLFKQVDYLNPYELLERILTRHDGRNRLVARLGPEAEIGIDALLALALEYENQNTPSLTGFIVWLGGDSVEIKRQNDAAGGRIRVMTTHGAKGLEAPIVILPDTGDRTSSHLPEIVKSATGMPLWRVPVDKQPEIMRIAVSDYSARQEEERQRLLYVALTRAEKWLIICGSGKIKAESDSWYQKSSAGMASLGFQNIETPTGGGFRYQHGNWVSTIDAKDTELSVTPTQLPPWADQPAPPTAPVQRVFSPSRMDGLHSVSDAQNETSREDALARGNFVHLLLEQLPTIPKDKWRTASFAMSAQAKESHNNNVDETIEEVINLLSDPDLAEIFTSGSLSEVSISAEIAGLGRMHGIIDRLLVDENRVLIVDFKSNRHVPKHPTDIPDAILRQLGAYLTGIEQIYKSHKIELAILWTKDAKLMPVPHDIVRTALKNTHHLDVSTNQP